MRTFLVKEGGRPSRRIASNDKDLSVGSFSSKNFEVRRNVRMCQFLTKVFKSLGVSGFQVSQTSILAPFGRMLLVKARGYRMMVHGSSIDARFFLFFFMLHMSFLLLAMATNTLSSNGRIKDGETLVSGNKLFQLRFFSPEGTQRRFIGISYHENLTSNQTVWVANRENPLENNTGILTMRADGKLLVSYENGNVVWSTNFASTRYTNSSVAVLEDNGNLVVREASSGSVVWESFDHPCNTLLPGMKIGINLTSGSTRMLTAWRNKSDPSPGMYALGIDPQDPSQFFFWRGSVPYRRVIFWNGSSFNAFRNFHGHQVLPLNKWTRNASVVRTHDEVYLTISPSPGKLRSWLTIGPSDNLETSGAGLINYFSTAPAFAVNSLKSSCSEHVCGPNSSCNEEEEPICKCLPGYKPMSTALWYSGQWSDGCIPILELQCGAKDRYLTLKTAKWPWCSVFYCAVNATRCQQICNDEGCSCRAYAWAEFYEHDCPCCLWRDGLKDIQEGVDDNGDGSGLVLREVNIRIASQLLSQEGRRCGVCGAIAVPYPLSISPSCGDPAYNSFHCNSSNGQLHFRGLDGSSYVVSRISKEDRTFVIKPQGIDLCLARSAKRTDIHLNSSLPFHLTNSNTVLLLNCSSMLEKMSHLNCSSSSPCHRYIQEGKAPCFHSKTCCSYTTGSSESNTSHDIGVLDNQCASYASIVNLDSSAFTDEWDSGIQIEWDAPQEPVCDSNKNCSAWPNSSCRTHNTEVEGKRCLCKDNFLWDPLSMNCTPGGTNNKSPISLTRSSGNKKLILIVTATVAAAIIVPVAFAYCLWRRKSRRKVKQNQLPNTSLLNVGESFRANELLDLANGNDNLDIPFVDFKCIIEATENFSDSNRLGRGGFGPVYKGKLPGGQEIAVKRLSRRSGQGLEEFKNEVLLIARLQHRNLVRMLGYCIEEDEKMLIYEYMPNKSLDFFLFENTRRTMLEWEKRINIIMGIARGLLYLHQDSRLRIIHRDLKTSNILLDKDMNPKISDFGMARIFGANQTQENTNRVVGTYGYISPEYAANGIYSVKSDVYSFGIIILEIVSGKKNADFLKEDDATSLAAYAWQLWKEEKGLDFMDPSLRKTYNEIQVLKSVHLGLLCVQDKASDRPTMSSVLAMLDSESATLPPPNQPAFFTGCFPASSSGGFNQMPSYSNNEVTISTLEAR